MKATDATDAELLSALHGGDLGALRTLYDRHAPWLTVRLTRRCSDPDMVADALQDCFTAVWREAGKWRGEGDVAAWIWGIAVRRLISRLRQHPQRHLASATQDWSRDTIVGHRPEAEASTPSAEELVLLGTEYGQLGAALGHLSPELRAVVQATVLDGLTSREAGRLLGIPQGTVKTRLHRAKAQLRADLAGGLA